MDVFLLQVGCANMDPDHFILNLIYKFNLEKWFVFLDEARTKVEFSFHLSPGLS